MDSETLARVRAEVEELRKLEAAASKGPWRYVPHEEQDENGAALLGGWGNPEPEAKWGKGTSPIAFPALPLPPTAYAQPRVRRAIELLRAIATHRTMLFPPEGKLIVALRNRAPALLSLAEAVLRQRELLAAWRAAHAEGDVRECARLVGELDDVNLTIDHALEDLASGRE